MSTQSKQEWGTKLGVVLAVAGSAVGLGNFLRFPGQVANNGGGSFMIPYFCALLFLGIPIGWAEWAMGRYGGSKGLHGAPGIMGLFGRGRAARMLGIVGVLIPLVVYFYYIIIEGWCLQYCLEYATGGLGISADANSADQVAKSAEHFNAVSGNAADGSHFDGSSWTMLAIWAGTFALNVWFLARGLRGGIEKVCTWGMPIMAVCALIVLIRVFTLGTPDPTHPDQNVAGGLEWMWTPKLSELADFDTWLAAAGQIFFSLSVGFGVIINYASYVKRKEDVVLSGLTASGTNEFFEVGFGGLITVPAAFIFLGLAGTAAAVKGGSFGLGFKTLPVVFAEMPMGNLFGALWFFMLFLAAITSSLSMLQPTLAFIEEATGISRKMCIAITTGIGLIGSAFTLYYSKDLMALDTFDFWVGTVLIFIMAMLQIVAFSWIFGIDRGMRELEDGAAMRIPPILRFILKYVSPVYLLIVWIGFATQNLPGYIDGLNDKPVARIAIIIVAVVAAFLAFLALKSEKRTAHASNGEDDPRTAGSGNGRMLAVVGVMVGAAVVGVLTAKEGPAAVAEVPVVETGSSDVWIPIVVVSVGFVVGLTAWCYWRLLRTPKAS